MAILSGFAMVRTTALLLVAIALSAGCRPVDAAPGDVDGLSKWFWTSYADASDGQIADAVDQLGVAIDGDTLAAPVDGTISDLKADDIAQIDVFDGADPTLAAGMFLADVINCPLNGVEGILTALDQQDLYVHAYDDYQRVYLSDAAAYFERSAETLDWDPSIDGRLANSPYHESLRGGTRYVGDETSSFGPVLLKRSWLPAPAEFDAQNHSFDQNYQVEVYDERAPGETVHFVAMWPQFRIAGLDQDDGTVQRTVLNDVVDWDQQTTAICTTR